MDTEVLRWLLAQLGPDTNPDDLAQRYERLGSARAVVQEMLQERISALLAEPLRVTVNGIATIDQTGNLAAFERRLAQVTSQPAPDEVPEGADDLLTSVPLVPRRRR
ncbi:hypothetical protein AW27_023255 [Streptomyces sp. PCS3-D2]|uniref:hypothetical protein n=1 Tax=Streptomyces sp. PCS3-D2 TaxID=1460244 RepID=UPI00044A21AC|nr:hypothetical protein [Streptomyces sp. PCS3-D2]WKV74163.1 hypothetical protein AW27_023255 [Streptomyces sp. PCS3-D2]